MEIIIPVVVLTLGFLALIIFLIIKFFKFLLSPIKTTPVINNVPNIKEVTNTDEWKQFIASRTKYWDDLNEKQEFNGVFDEVIRKATSSLLESYQKNEVRFYKEIDLHAFLYQCCIREFEKKGFSKPFPIYMGKNIGNRMFADLILGENDTVVEMKLEANYPGVSKPVVFDSDILKDLKKIETYKSLGVTNPYFFMIDEDGMHVSILNNLGWNVVNTVSSKSYYLYRKIYEVGRFEGLQYNISGDIKIDIEKNIA